MTLKIKPSTNLNQLQRQIGQGDAEKLRESQKRRRYLETLASLHCGEDVYVQLNGSEAYADIASADDEMGYTDRVVINVPVEVPEQKETGLDERLWDILFQKTELYHELGHVLYTDWPSFEDTMFGSGAQYGVSMNHRSMYKDWWNILEDAAIERQLSHRFDIGNDLKIKNENLLRGADPAQMNTLHSAISMALMEYKHEMGRLDTLLDANDDEFVFFDNGDAWTFEKKILPIIREYAPEVKGEGDPEERNKLIYEMYEEIRPLLGTSEQLGENDDITEKFDIPDDGEKRGDESEGKVVALPEMTDEEKKRVHTQMDPDEDYDEEEREGGVRGAGIETEVKRKYSDELKQERDGEDEDNTEAESEAWLQVVQTNYNEYDRELELEVDCSDDHHDADFDSDTMGEAKRMSNALSREFEQRLEQERKSDKVGGQRSGKPDTGAMYKSNRGDTRLFQRTSDPDEKDYNAIILLDRSGSMNDYDLPDMIPDCEAAAGALSYALDDVGVDTSVISFLSGDCRLEKPFGSSVDSHKEALFNGAATGGTPLSDALALARTRLEEKGGNPFVITITDGLPDHREAYRDELHECNFPVLGIYVDQEGNFENDRKDESAYFHKLVYTHYEEVMDATRAMTKSVMF